MNCFIVVIDKDLDIRMISHKIVSFVYDIYHFFNLTGAKVSVNCAQLTMGFVILLLYYFRSKVCVFACKILCKFD